MRKVQKGDVVKVITGGNKKKIGKVLAVKGERIVVEGVNVATKFVKKGALGKGSEGQTMTFEKPIHISNIMMVDNDGTSTTRIKIKVVEGKKVRTNIKGDVIIKEKKEEKKTDTLDKKAKKNGKSKK